jgi:hypothetical protein
MDQDAREETEWSNQSESALCALSRSREHYSQDYRGNLFAQDAALKE